MNDIIVIKLADSSVEGKTHHVFLDHIVNIVDYDGYTAVTLSTGFAITVQESADKILSFIRMELK